VVNRPIVIVGAGGHAVSVADLAVSAGFSPIAFVDAKSDRREIHDIPVLINFDSISNSSSVFCAIAIGDNYQRLKVVSAIKKSHPSYEFPSLVHSSASIGSWSSVGEGSLIFAGSRVGANCKIGEFSILNTNASLDHDSTLGAFASLAPGVTTGGRVSIGTCSAVGLGSAIKHGVTIGAHTVIGSASNVLRNFEDLGIVFGNPAEWIEDRKNGDSYL
jgi:sugar O-acyltransferase (sialic acid O-acetyltransferase NeuD family)